MLAPILAAAAALSAQTTPDAQEDYSAKAYFAAGCFWCAEADFEKLDGVGDVISGFTGGDAADPTYKEVSRGGTGHYEAVEAPYDPDVVSYDELLYHFWRNHDPYDAGGQFCDRGDSYRPAIFAAGETQREDAEASKAEVQDALSGEVITPILGFERFYPAESYHQDYYKSDDRILSRFGYVEKQDAYEGYREGCGRDARLKEVWGDEAKGYLASKGS